MRHPRKQIFPTTADIAAPSSLCGELAAAAAGVLGGFTKRNHTGAFVPRERVTDSVARATNMIVDPTKNIPQRHKADGRHFGTQALLFCFVPFGVGGRLHGAAFASLRLFSWRYSSIITFSVLVWNFFVERGRGIYIFFPLNMLDGHFLYMFNWIVLCASRTKIIVPRLSVENHLGTKKDFKNVQRSK